MRSGPSSNKRYHRTGDIPLVPLVPSEPPRIECPS